MRLLCFLCLLPACWGAAADQPPVAGGATPPAGAASLVTIKTGLGDIVVGLDDEAAPLTVANFLRHVDADAYDNTIFHRVIPGFAAQGGGHYADMSMAPEGEPLFNEAANGLKNLRGTLAMARTAEIDSARRQFFINLADNHFLDHNELSCTRQQEAAAMQARAEGMYRPLTCQSYGYAVFGRVVSGMDVVDRMAGVETGSVGPHNDVPAMPIVILSVERSGPVKPPAGSQPPAGDEPVAASDSPAGDEPVAASDSPAGDEPVTASDAPAEGEPPAGDDKPAG